MKASHNFGQGKIFIIPAAGIDILEGQLEVELGKTLQLPISMFGNHLGQRTTFTQCNKVPLEVSLSDQKVFEAPGNHIENVINNASGNNQEEDAGEDMTGACTWMDMKARTPGFSRTKVQYSLM